MGKKRLVLAPLVFSRTFLNAGAVTHALLAVLLFLLPLLRPTSSTTCTTSSVTVVSKTRPLAAVIVSVPAALILLVALYVVL